jgi:hypothetical protein
MVLSTALSVVAIVVGVVSAIGFSIEFGGSGPILFGAWWIALGGITLSASTKTWQREGKAVGLDHQGVHYWRDTLVHHGQHIVIPWDDIRGVRAVSFYTEDWEEGLLLDLESSAPNPAGGYLAGIAASQQEPPLQWKDAALLHNWYWEWYPWEVERQIGNMLREGEKPVSTQIGGTA